MTSCAPGPIRRAVLDRLVEIAQKPLGDAVGFLTALGDEFIAHACRGALVDVVEREQPPTPMTIACTATVAATSAAAAQAEPVHS